MMGRRYKNVCKSCHLKLNSKLKLMILSKSQKQALDTLLPIANIALSVDKSELPIKPRTHSLMCAPSGAGKSFLMKALGEILNIPVLYLNTSNWAVLGSRCESYTWDCIVDFVNKHPKGIIVLDEIDKISSTQSEWLGLVRLEIFDLLDGRVPTTVDVSSENSSNSDLW